MRVRRLEVFHLFAAARSIAVSKFRYSCQRLHRNSLNLRMTSFCNISQDGIWGFLLSLAAIWSASRVSIHLRYWNLSVFGFFCIVTVGCTPRWHHRSYSQFILLGHKILFPLQWLYLKKWDSKTSKRNCGFKHGDFCYQRFWRSKIPKYLLDIATFELKLDAARCWKNQKNNILPYACLWPR